MLPTCAFCDAFLAYTPILKTHDEKNICGPCQKKLHLCEVCGSITRDTNPDNQLHYEEECFK